MTKPENEIFVSVDVESDGPIPGPYSMLSIGLVAFTLNRGIFSEWSVNLELIPGAQVHPKTKKFWDANSEAYTATRISPVPPHIAMAGIADWCTEICPNGYPIVTAYPAGYDWTFLYWYMHRFYGDCPFGFQAHDMKTYASAVLKLPFRSSTKSRMPKRWFDAKVQHNHIALDDAREQAIMCINMMKENLLTNGN